MVEQQSWSPRRPDPQDVSPRKVPGLLRAGSTHVHIVVHTHTHIQV